MTKTKILFISQCFPLPLDGGGKIKTFNTLQTLAQAYDVFAVFISERSASQQQLQAMAKLGIKCKVFKATGMSENIKNSYWRLAWNYLQLRPHFVYQYRFPPAQHYIKHKIDHWQPHIIHVDHINSSQFLPKKNWLKKHYRQQATLILENHNVDHYLFATRFHHSKKLIRKLYLFLEGHLNQLYGWLNYPRYDHILSISERESRYLRRLNQSVIDQPLIYPLTKVKRRKQKRYDVLFIGHLEWPPNEVALQWLIDEVWPLVLKKLPQLKLHIVGKEGPRLAKLKDQAGVVFHGYQANIDPFLASSKIFVLPFHTGSGVRIKALTALQNGIPLVSTSLGVDGLKLTANQDFLLANSVKGFAQAIEQLIIQPELAKRYSQAGQTYFQQHHSLKQQQQLLDIYSQLSPTATIVASSKAKSGN